MTKASDAADKAADANTKTAEDVATKAETDAAKPGATEATKADAEAKRAAADKAKADAEQAKTDREPFGSIDITLTGSFAVADEDDNTASFANTATTSQEAAIFAAAKFINQLSVTLLNARNLATADARFVADEQERAARAERIKAAEKATPDTAPPKPAA